MSKLAGLDDIAWPYEQPEGLGDDAFGSTYLRHEGGAWWWYAYEWGETNQKRLATDAEVIDALLAHIRDAEKQANADAPYERLGRAVAAVLPDAMSKSNQPAGDGDEGSER